jgi:hypothetical protein
MPGTGQPGVGGLSLAVTQCNYWSFSPFGGVGRLIIILCRVSRAGYSSWTQARQGCETGAVARSSPTCMMNEFMVRPDL